VPKTSLNSSTPQQAPRATVGGASPHHVQLGRYLYFSKLLHILVAPEFLYAGSCVRSLCSSNYSVVSRVTYTFCSMVQYIAMRLPAAVVIAVGLYECCS
jgi:hypothetical protein